MNKKDVNQIKWGAILSYLLIIANACYGLFLTPYMIGKLGQAEYGVYKTIASFSSSLMVLDFGLGGTVMRYLAQYRAKKEEEKIPRFVFMALTQALLLVALLFCVSGVIFFNIEMIFGGGLTDAEIVKAKSLFVVLTINMGLHMFENVINGIITGHNEFVFGNLLKISRLGFRIVLICVILQFIRNSMVLVFIDLGITVLFLIFEIYFISRKLHVKIVFAGWDMVVFKESMQYTFWMFLTSIAAQVNNNLDNVIIGAMKGAKYVTVYSMGLLIFSMFENFSTAISGVLLPTMTKIVNSDADGKETQKFIIKIGRIQFIILGAVFVGFLVLGLEFINIWLGKGYEDVYFITLILMLPALFELCVNACLAVLRAKNMLKFRTIVLIVFTIVNAVISIAGIKIYDTYFAAAVGTAVSFCLGSVLVMGLYYHFKLGYNMLNIYKKIIGKTWICLAIAGGITFIASKYIHGSLLTFIICGCVFGVVYLGSLYVFGCDATEKMQMRKTFKLKK